MTLVNGWFDWAVRRPGPDWKQNGGINPSTFFVGHSAVGPKSAFYGEMMGTAKKSVHLFNPKEGPVEQLYATSVQCWSSGHGIPNNNSLSMELEGGLTVEQGGPGANEPMTPSQYANVVRVLKDWTAANPGIGDVWRPTTPKLTALPQSGALTEHTQWYATACPSGRYPWFQIEALVNAAAVKFAVGDSTAGIELRGTQIVFWIGGVDVVAIGDPENEGPGRIAKRFGDEWRWLIMSGVQEQQPDGHIDRPAVWCPRESD